MERISKMWLDMIPKLDNIVVDDSIGFVGDSALANVIVSPYAYNTQICINEVNFIRMAFLFDGIFIGSESVLEVGAGYGNYCKVFCEEIDTIDYTIIDIKSMLRLSKQYLKVKDVECNFVDVEDCESVFDKRYSLLISNVCLSEMPEEFVIYLLNNILPICDKFTIIDTDHGSFYTNIVPLLDKYFHLKTVSCKQCEQFNHNLYFGSRKRDIL